MFVNPRKVISVWIHNPLLMEGKYKHVRVRDEEILLFHSRDNKVILVYKRLEYVC